MLEMWGWREGWEDIVLFGIGIRVENDVVFVDIDVDIVLEMSGGGSSSVRDV